MPSNIVKTPKDEERWKEAKKAARKQYPGLESREKEKFYKIVTHIFEVMKQHKNPPINKSAAKIVIGGTEFSLFEGGRPTLKELMGMEPSKLIEHRDLLEALKLRNQISEAPGKLSPVFNLAKGLESTSRFGSNLLNFATGLINAPSQITQSRLGVQLAKTNLQRAQLELAKMQRQSGMLSRFMHHPLGHGASMLGAGALLGGGMLLGQSIINRIGSEMTFNTIIKDNPELQVVDKNKLKEIYNTMVGMAPTVSNNPVLAGRFLVRVMNFGALDPTLMNELVELERNVTSLRGTHIQTLGNVMNLGQGFLKTANDNIEIGGNMLSTECIVKHAQNQTYMDFIKLAGRMPNILVFNEPTGKFFQMQKELSPIVSEIKKPISKRQTSPLSEKDLYPKKQKDISMQDNEILKRRTNALKQQQPRKIDLSSIFSDPEIMAKFAYIQKLAQEHAYADFIK